MSYKIPPDGLKILLECSQIYLRLGFFRQAKEILEGLLAVEPTLTILYVFLGNCLVAEERYKEAILFYEKALEIEPSNGFALVNLAEALLMNKKFKEAFEILDKVKSSEDLTNSRLAMVLLKGAKMGLFNLNSEGR